MAPAKKLFSRYVELGRVVLIQFGPDAGKLATIVDVVDQNRLLLDGPTNLTGVGRHVINIKWVALTDLKVKVARNARQKTLTQAWTEAGTMDKWNATAWAKKIAAKKTKASLTDFQRFQAKNKQQKLMKAVRAKVAA